MALAPHVDYGGLVSVPGPFACRQAEVWTFVVKADGGKLDALCKRFDVDNTHRQLHGALLDAQLLAEVYIGLTSGQSEIGFEIGAEAANEAAITFEVDVRAPRPRVVVAGEDLEAHEARLAQLRKKAGWAVWDAWSDVVEAATQYEAMPA